jgi:potassium efflux system protein
MRRRPQLASRARLALAVLLAVSAAPAAGQAVPGTAEPPTATTAPPAPSVVPVPEVASRAEDLAAQLRTLAQAAAPDPEVEALAAGLPARGERVRRALAETDQILAQQPQLPALGHLAATWEARRDVLGRRSTLLAARALALENDLDMLLARRDLWTRTRDDARTRSAPDAVMDRIGESLALIRATQRRVEAARAQVLAVQDELARLRTDVDAVLARIEDRRRELVGRLFMRDSPPIWRLHATPGDARVLSRLADDVRAQMQRIVDLRDAYGLAALVQAALLAGLAALFQRARRRAARWAAGDADLAPAARVLARPWSSAVLLTLAATVFLYPVVPYFVAQLLAAAALIPILRILRAVVAAPLVPALSLFAGFFLIDRLRSVTAVAPALDQAVFLVEMGAAVALVAIVLRRTPPRAEAVRGAVAVVLGVFVVAFVAAALGYLQLAQLLGEGVLTSAYLAMALHAVARALGGLVASLLRGRTLQRLAMVRTQRDVLQARAEIGIRWLVVVVWVVATLSVLQLLVPVRAAVARALASDLAPGRLVVTLGDVAAFAVTVWAAFLVSRLLRFTLEQEVFPRVQLGRGMPYAASTLLHYVVLGVGFVLALGALGLDINRFTVLAGAFGVGIGFGLQNVVSNFVSGLILLFERPIQVGDVVQIADVTGQVQRIGVRSSTIRTPQGADVVVPNASLIQERVTNWTFADRLRRMDVRVGVAYGTDPDRVLALLREVALANKRVLSVPAPEALFVGFGNSSLDFELWAWTARGDEFMSIRSELGVALVRALAEAGIEIPFPQHDVHLRPAPPPAGRP